MPALVLFGRRSRVGSDDLYCPAFFLILYQLPFVLLAVGYISFWRSCSSMSFSAHGIPFWFMLGAIPIYGFMACVYLMVMHVSSKGTIVEYERRMLMPRLLRVHVLWSGLLFAYGVAGIVFWYNLELCFPDAHFVLTIAGAMVAEVSFTFTFGFCILGGAPPPHRHHHHYHQRHHKQPRRASAAHIGATHGQYQARDNDDERVSHYGTTVVETERQSLLAEMDRAIPNSDVYVPHQQRWEQRCNALCACVRCFTCGLFGGAGTQHDSMSVVANVLARLFYGSPDLVISDIVAGFILLAAVQAHDEEQEQVCQLLSNTGAGDLDYHLNPQQQSPEGVASLRELRQRLKNDANYVGGSSYGDASSNVSSNVSSVSFSSGSTSNLPPSTNQLGQGDGYVAISILSPDITSTGSTIPITASGSQSPPVTQNLLLPFDPTLAERVEELAHFSKYAVGIYGWMLYVWSHPWTATFRLAFSCMKTSRTYIHGDNMFHLGQAALQLESQVRAHDIVYASFKNTVYRPAFCVLLDHARKEVVITIRGTLSLEDCLTDAIAYGKPLDELADRIGCDGKGEYAHQGFLHCAESLYQEINRLGLLQMLFDPHTNASIALNEVNACPPGEYREYGLVVTGHSLGSATAVLLSVMLRPKYPHLRCFAFSPPGCTVSPGLARRCDEFVTSVVVGHDIIARASLTSAEELRDQVIDLIGRSKVGKSAILRQVMAWKKPHELLHDELQHHQQLHGETQQDGAAYAMGSSAFGAHLANYRTMLQRIQASEPINPLTIPGRIIHLKRTEAHRNVGCWVCCRPGSGGVCCTERTDYGYAWSTADQFKSIRIARTMLDDHFPDKVHHVLQDCARRLRPNESNGCMYNTGRSTSTY